MEELGKALKSIFDKLLNFFDIFDMSFFISGSVTTALVLYCINKHDIIDLDLPDKGIIIAALVILCYINGLLSFAAGRAIRNNYLKFIGKTDDTWRETAITALIPVHKLNDIERYKKYSGNNMALYTRLWSDLRQNDKCEKSLNLINRYWVMSATYDGLVFSSLVAGAIFVFNGIAAYIAYHEFEGIYLLLLFLSLAAFHVCGNEARRMQKYQLEELLATIASCEESK